ncbi:MAG: septum formation initiator family protein [Moraxellaceae bacterium]
MERTLFGKLLLLIAVAVFIGLQVSLWVGEGGVRDLRRHKSSIATLQKENEKLAERNRVLEAEVRDLKNGLEAVEEHSRLDLGMIRDNETFYLVTGNPDARRTPAPPPAAAEAP